MIPNQLWVQKIEYNILLTLIWIDLEMCMLSNDIYDYYIVSQGKITIPNVDDGEECVLTDVSSASRVHEAVQASVCHLQSVAP